MEGKRKKREKGKEGKKKEKTCKSLERHLVGVVHVSWTKQKNIDPTMKVLKNIQMNKHELRTTDGR